MLIILVPCVIFNGICFALSESLWSISGDIIIGKAFFQA